MKKETKCAHAGGFDKATGALSVPIYQSATFKHTALGDDGEYSYSRLQNPTRQALENAVAELEGGVGAIAFTTGMAAHVALFELFSPGDHIIATEDIYGGTTRLLRTINKKNGVECSFVDTSDIKAIESAITKNTKAIFIETPTNPMMHVTSIVTTSKLAKKHGLKVIVDNTFLTPYYLQPLSLGADIVTHSGTKFLSGHNDTLAGFVVFKDKAVEEEVRYIAKTIGACLSPFDSWLLLRGLKTLPIRMDRSQENAQKIVEFLLGHKKVKKVYYAGLEDSKGYDIMKDEASGFGSMISFEVDSHETVKQVLAGVKVIYFAESLGGVETLVTFPSVQTHGDIPVEEKDKRGINDRLLRLSIGIENVADLLDDLRVALG